MGKKPLLVVSLCVVVLLVLGSVSNVVGYQTVQTSQQNLIKERIDQRELLFQTICDIANNQEIQRIILKSQIRRGIFPTSEMPVITKNHLRQMYLLGVLLLRFIRTSRIQSIIGKYQFSTQGMQKEISAVFEKDVALNAELIQLQNSECDCENEQTSSWGFPILCSILNVLMIIPLILFAFGLSLGALALWFRLIGLIGSVIVMITVPIIYAIINVGTLFDCNWWFVSP